MLLFSGMQNGQAKACPMGWCRSVFGPVRCRGWTPAGASDRASPGRPGLSAVFGHASGGLRPAPPRPHQGAGRRGPDFRRRGVSVLPGTWGAWAAFGPGMPRSGARNPCLRPGARGTGFIRFRGLSAGASGWFRADRRPPAARSVASWGVWPPGGAQVPPMSPDSSERRLCSGPALGCG